MAAKPSNDVVALRAARCTARMATSLPQQSPGSTDWLAGRLGTIDSFQTSIRHADAKTTTLLTALAGLAALVAGNVHTVRHAAESGTWPLTARWSLRPSSSCRRCSRLSDWSVRSGHGFRTSVVRTASRSRAWPAQVVTTRKLIPAPHLRRHTNLRRRWLASPSPNIEKCFGACHGWSALSLPLSDGSRSRGGSANQLVAVRFQTPATPMITPAALCRTRILAVITGRLHECRSRRPPDTQRVATRVSPFPPR